MSRELVSLVEAFENKHNSGGTPAGQRVAHAEIGKKVHELVESKKLDPQRVSFKGLHESLVVSRGLEENIVSSAFPVIAGELISSVIIQAYQAFPKSGDKLVRTVPSRLKESKIVGWKAIGVIRQVNEREPYSQVTPPDEKYVRIQNKKYGGLMDLTREAIFFDQTGELLDRARSLGEEGARFREEIIMTTIVDGLSKSLDNGQLYNSGNNNLITSNPLGTLGWENVHTALLGKKDDNTGKPIWVMGEAPVMVVAPNLWPKAERLRTAESGPAGQGAALGADPNLARNMFELVINPYLTFGSTEWYYGGFNRQFRWEEVWPLETYTRVGQDTEEGFNKDVIQQFKVSLYGGCGAVDTRYVFKNQAGA